MRRSRCWRCSEEQAPAFFCNSCGAVQSLPGDTDYLDILGLPANPAIDTSALQETYYALSRRLHPDRFVDASPEELRASVSSTALLNSAWKTLRDPEARGRWWLARQAEALGRYNNSVPPAIAALVFEVQEELAKSRGSDAAAMARVQKIYDSLETRRSVDIASLEAQLADWPERASADAEKIRLDELKSHLAELSYLAKLRRDVKRALEEL
ncbi:MAG: hypothetical protein ABGY42_01915 [bacterium]